MSKKSPQQHFQDRFLFLANHQHDLTDFQVIQLCLAALADLAADLPEPSVDQARQVLIAAAERVEALLQDRIDVYDVISHWKRQIIFTTEDTSRQLRTRAIKDAERVLRSLGEDHDGSHDTRLYFSSTVSQ